MNGKTRKNSGCRLESSAECIREASMQLGMNDQRSWLVCTDTPQQDSVYE